MYILDERCSRSYFIMSSFSSNPAGYELYGGVNYQVMA